MNKKLVMLCSGILAIGASLGGETRQVATPQELVDALNELNGDSLENVIELTSPSYDMGTVDMMTPSGDLACHLEARKVTVRGRSDNPRDTVVYGNGTARIFALYAAARLHNLTVSNGYATAKYAGGVWAEYYSAVCSNCVITCNVGSGLDCGGVYYATCYDCEICGNSSAHGAGANNATIWGGSIHHNTAAKSGGGGLNVTAHGVKIYANTAGYGGGLSANRAITSEGCEIYDNVATADDGGGAIRCITSGKDSVVILTNCVLRGNTARYGGACMHATLVDCVVSNNVAIEGGGAMSSLVYDSLLCSNRATTASFGKGGGGVSGCTVLRSVVSNNFAVSCGGGVLGGSVSDSQVVKNLTRPPNPDDKTRGAGCYGAVVSNCTIAGNAIAAVGEAYGGGACDCTLTDCVIRDNFASYGSAFQGGTASNCLVTNNPFGRGYAIRTTQALTGCRVFASQIESPGAMTACTISGYGCSDVLEPGMNVLTSGTFSCSGSFICNSQASLLAATNCLFCGNRGDLMIVGPGRTDGVIRLVNCTFSGNRYGAVVSGVPGSKNGTAEIRNCLFAGNLTKNGQSANDFNVDSLTDTQILMSNCLIQTPVNPAWRCDEFVNIITNSPRFVLEGDHPYSIKHSSPARQKGLVMDWMADAYDIRGEGYPRLRDGKVDIGCYQCWLVPNGFMMLLR